MKQDAITFTPQQESKGVIIRKDTDPGNCLLVIFGATGDLARHKLFPALYGLAAEKKLPEKFEIIGYSHTDRNTDSFAAQMRRELEEKYQSTFNSSVWEWLAARLHYVPGDFAEQSDYHKLTERITALEKENKTPGNRIFYLATASPFFSDILHNLQDTGLARQTAGDHKNTWRRVVIEKPFGTDVESAGALDRQLAAAFDRDQIFRVDHYMAKETVQNILVLRFANSIFEPLWNRNHIDHVQITAAEDAGITSRGSFYDKTGVVRDVIQNHLMQILSLVAMESPVSFNSRDFHDEKSKFFRSLRPLMDETLERDVVLGQYSGYNREKDVARHSQTPTFAAMQIFIDNWRWQGVPFFIRAGKGLAAKLTEICIFFKPIPTCLFGDTSACGHINPNVLTMRIQPDEGITLSFSCKVPGDHLEVDEVTMDFSYGRAFAGKKRAAYERLLLDCMRGDNLLFGRSDCIMEQWSFVEPLLTSPDDSPPLTVHEYEKGSEGPAAAADLIHQHKRSWRSIRKNCPRNS